jgi:hypothetical protein
MRTRRRFQPILDSMPSRIALSAVGLPAPAILAGIPAHLTAGLPGVSLATPMDTSGTGTSSPIIVGSPNPPPTLPC